MAVTLGIVPALLALLPRLAMRAQQAPETNDSVTRRISQLIVRQASWAICRRSIKIAVEGLEYVPCSGPVLIVARHFHHLYDGCVLLRAIPRRLHILVALDWVQKRWMRGVMERACALTGWPALLRVERLNERISKHSKRGHGAYSLDEARGYLRRAAKDSFQLLRNGQVLAVFPEAYPNIDPAFTPKDDIDAFLPFRPGFAKLVEMVERDGRTKVAIVPAGLTYSESGRWHATLRFGPAHFRDDYIDSAHLVQTLERRVRDLSDQTASSAPTHTEETIQL